MEDAPTPRRVVTGFTEAGTPCVLFDGPAPGVTRLPPEVGASLVDLWRSEDLPLDTTTRTDPTAATFELMPAGMLFRVIDLEPGTADPMWHTTASVDCNYVAEGSVTVLVARDDGDPIEIDLAAGDTLVHRGPRHAWLNKSDRTCRLVTTSIAAQLPADYRPPPA